MVILYVRHISESIRQILTPLEIQTCFCLHCTLRQTLVNLKDRILLQQWAGVVYRIPCGTCPKVYVGQTCRTLNHSLKEHKRALTIFSKDYTKTDYSKTRRIRFSLLWGDGLNRAILCTAYADSMQNWLLFHVDSANGLRRLLWNTAWICADNLSSVANVKFSCHVLYLPLLT